MTREEALKRISKPELSEKELNDEFEFVAKKLDFSVDELRKLFRSENKTYNDFPNNKYLINLQINFVVMGVDSLSHLGCSQN